MRERASGIGKLVIFVFPSAMYLVVSLRSELYHIQNEGWGKKKLCTENDRTGLKKDNSYFHSPPGRWKCYVSLHALVMYIFRRDP